jgi:hypothetical protein
VDKKRDKPLEKPQNILEFYMIKVSMDLLYLFLSQVVIKKQQKVNKRKGVFKKSHYQEIWGDHKKSVYPKCFFFLSSTQ